ncbi:MAG: mechanosensitive ion channel family protein [Paludibacteraceae bacterium]
MKTKTLAETLDFSILTLGKNFNITLLDLIEIGIIVLITLLVLFLIRQAINRSKRLDSGKKYSINNLIRYTIYVISLSLILNALGLDLKFALAGSAALLVGVGLGLQNLFSDFVSGIILLVDSSVKVGDVIDVDGLVCQVKDINFRTTLVLTRDDKFILLPNSNLTKNKLINWTHHRESTRFEVSVGVDYSSDVNQVIKLMEKACFQNEEVMKEPEPFVRFDEFGDSSLVFTAYFWCNNVFRVGKVKSDLRIAIFKAFNENNITIPFPQRVLHYHDKTEEGSR